MRERARVPRPAAVAAALAIVAIVVVALATSGGASAPSAVPFDGRSPRAPEAGTIRVLFELQRPSLGERVAGERMDAAGQRAHVRSLRREADALQSALRARAVRLGGVVSFERVWNGFAATIETEDLPRVQTLGVRVERVRRFYPATVELAQADGAPDSGGAHEAGGEPDSGGARELGADVALLDSGVDLRHPALRGRVVPGYDAVDGDDDPSPGRAPGGDVEQHGTQMAGVLASELGGRVRAIRVAGLQRSAETAAFEEAGTTDQLLAGLERAVDPDDDGDTDDGAAVALVGVNSPYAGFAGAPEADAVRAAAALGTLVVAPAGNEGRRAGRFGTVGSPGAAPDALTVGALEGSGAADTLPAVRLGLAGEAGRATLDGHLLGGNGTPLRAPALGLVGPSQADPSAKRRASGSSVLEYFSVDARPRARGRLVVVQAIAGGTLATVAVAARAAGAAGVVVCDPSGARLRGVPRAAAGDIPVIGLSGDAARRALDLTDDGEALAFVSAPHAGSGDGEARVAPASSEGPTYALTPKPDLLATGTATAPTVRRTRTSRTGRYRGHCGTFGCGGEGFAAGTSVAAARVAAVAARLARVRPAWTPRQLAAALVGTAELGSPGAPAGVPDPDRAAAAPLLAEPRALSLERRSGDRSFSVAGQVVLHNPGGRVRDVTMGGELPGGLRVEIRPARLRLAPGAARRVTVRVTAPAPIRTGFRVGGIELRTGGDTVARVPLAIPVGPPPPAPLGALELVREEGRVRGVRFAAGRVRRFGDARAVLPLGRLTLRLERAGGEVVRELTPPGGATDLLPGEYAYTLTGATLRELSAGTYRFVAEARGPGAGAVRSLKRSARFEIDG